MMATDVRVPCSCEILCFTTACECKLLRELMLKLFVCCFSFWSRRVSVFYNNALLVKLQQEASGFVWFYLFLHHSHLKPWRHLGSDIHT